jgi:hypothetical protein
MQQEWTSSKLLIVKIDENQTVKFYKKPTSLLVHLQFLIAKHGWPEV